MALISKEDLLTKFETGALLFQPEVKRIIKIQPEVMTWIPVTERLPEPGKCYIVCDDRGFVTCARYYTFRYFDPSWLTDDDCELDVIAWMELPEPYKEPEDPSHPCAESVMMGERREDEQTK